MNSEPPIPCLGLDHIDLSVGDMSRSRAFYDSVLTALGFARRIDRADMVLWRLGAMEIGIRPATAALADAFDRYRTGLHHLAFRAASAADVDRFHAFLVEQGLPVLDPPAEYPQYQPGYYALFFADPDGMKLELVYQPPRA